MARVKVANRSRSRYVCKVRLYRVCCNVSPAVTVRARFINKSYVPLLYATLTWSFEMSSLSTSASRPFAAEGSCQYSCNYARWYEGLHPRRT